MFCVNSPHVFYKPRSILLVFLRFINLVLSPSPTKDPSLQYLKSLSKENSLKVTIGANTQGGKRDDLDVYIHQN